MQVPLASFYRTDTGSITLDFDKNAFYVSISATFSHV